MKTRWLFSFVALVLTGFVFLAAPEPALATIEWIAIGDTGNAGDLQPQDTYGAVDYECFISKFETTNAE